MDVLLLLTTAGADTGPFDLYENSTGSFVLFESTVDKADLTTLPGYATVVPSGTTTVRVQSTGLCTNYTDIVLEQSTTTSTSTTLAYSAFVVSFDLSGSPSPKGWTSDTDACSGSTTFQITLYAQSGYTSFADLLADGKSLYTSNTLINPSELFDGQGTWYKSISPENNVVVRISSIGEVEFVTTC